MRALSTTSHFRRRAIAATRRDTVRALRVWAGKTFEELVTEALRLNNLSIRDAARLTGLPYPRFSANELRRRARPETIEKLVSGLKLPRDVLYVRSNMLPPGAEDDVHFQDRIVYLWRKHQRRRNRPMT